MKLNRIKVLLDIFTILELRLITLFWSLLMAYLIMGSDRIGANQTNLHQAISSFTKWAVLRKMLSVRGMWNGGQNIEKAIRESPSSWDEARIHPSLARPYLNNYRTGHCVQASHRAPVRGFRALASSFPPVTRLVSDVTRTLH